MKVPRNHWESKRKVKKIYWENTTKVFVKVTE